MRVVPFRLKTDDRPSRGRGMPAATDPQAIGIELMAVLRQMADDAHALRDVFARGLADPVHAHRRGQARAVELAEQTARALDIAEDLLRACRAAGVFSTDTGV